MPETILIIIIAISFLSLGIALGMYIVGLKQKAQLDVLKERDNQLQRSLQQLKETLTNTEREREEIRREKELISTELTRRNSEFENLQRQNLKRDEELKLQQDQLRKDFELLANGILEKNSTKITEQNKLHLQTILTPLQEKIQTFEKKVEDTHKDSIDRHAALRQQILGLKELNEQMSKEAVNLTKALKGDSKTQGNWGELILERVLEKSGLTKDREYFLEKSFDTKETNKTRLRPDVIINLPGNKKMVVDSKVSLTAYEQFVNAEDETEQTKFLKEHVNSLHRHITQLSAKKYEDIYEMESPDFVLLFIPIEPAFATALNSDDQLYNKAFEKNIVIVTPSTLLATLRTIDSMWQNEKQRNNAIEIARQAGALYDKFEGLVTDLTKVGKKMDEAKNEYKDAMNKLVEGRGNLIKSVEKIKKLGAKAKKSLPQNIVDRASDEDR
ncbi:DNA recombination protein RmuC [Flavobacteriaceae bacterium F08102]|nr:DNA recombination protein RmuC [Flavobacteriaceae bacterium F08102]